MKTAMTASRPFHGAALAACALAALAAVAALSVQPAAAQGTGQAATPVTALAATELRADKLASAPVIAPVAQGAALRLISAEGTWLLVETAGGATGWVRSASVSAISAQAEAGGLTTRSLPSRVNRHALIIGVSRYADPNTPPLPGAHIDRQSATQMAEAMQVPATNITYLQDEQATGDNIRKALADLNARVLDGDRVFIHYSGHGTRYNDPAAGGCVEALLAHDGGQRGTITNRELADILRPITNKTDKLFVMYDACHSGGIIRNMPDVRTRGFSLPTDEGVLRPKFAAISEECGQPVNVKTRNLVIEAAAQGGLPQDIIHLSASRDNEVSFDDEQKGGLATQFMRDCMLRDARDLDGSGAITMDEIRICAQEKINKRMQNDRLFKPHNITLTGNPNFVPAWFSQAVAQGTAAVSNAVAAATSIIKPPMAQAAPVLPVSPPAPGLPVTVTQAPAATTAPSTTPAPQTGVQAAAPVSAPVVAATPVVAPLTGAQALRQMFEQRDAKRRVQVTLAKAQLKIGQDVLDFSVRSDRGGYVYVAQAGSDNKSVYLLFPNDIDQNNRIEPGQPLVLPRPNWRVRAGGPAGTDHLLVMVADGPRDFSAMAVNKAGPFIASLNDTAGRARLGALLSASRAATNGECGTNAARRSNPLCSDAFGASLVPVEEVK